MAGCARRLVAGASLLAGVVLGAWLVPSLRGQSASDPCFGTGTLVKSTSVIT